MEDLPLLEGKVTITQLRDTPLETAVQPSLQLLKIQGPVNFYYH